ncbi:MAG: hypothetical protein RLZZ303_2527, partial [Candidatus Hydrogenedentota bacterium]
MSLKSIGIAALCMLLPALASAETFSLKLRQAAPDHGRIETRPAEWPAASTAIIVCDVWDAHHSINAVKRLEEFVPRIDAVLKEARDRGAVIVHAPSDCMDAYAGHPARERAMKTKPAKPQPEGVNDWVMRLPSEQGARYPVDQSDGGEDDDPREHAEWERELEKQGRNPAMPWKAQHPGITIDAERDYISDRGGEVWNILEARGVEQVILVGVHTNMCVLGRPFGLRQMVRLGKQVALLRDLTDCMYNPASWPRVDHFTGNALVLDYIERHVCATITSDQILGGEPFRFAGDTEERGALPKLPPRDPAREWAPAPMAAPELPEGASTVWHRCVVERGGAGLALSFQEGFGIRMSAWLDGKPLEVI